MATPPDFSVGAVLTAAQMNAVGMWRVTSCTVTSSGGTAATANGGVISIGSGNTSVTVSDAFSADFNTYRIIISGSSAASTGMNIRLALGATATGYYTTLLFGTYGAGVVNATQSSQSNGNFFDWAGYANTTSLFGDITLINPQIAEHTIFESVFIQNGAGGIAGRTQGALLDTTAYTAFTITPSAGSFTSGNIRVYGYRL